MAGKENVPGFMLSGEGAGLLFCPGKEGVDIGQGFDFQDIEGEAGRGSKFFAVGGIAGRERVYR